MSRELMLNKEVLADIERAHKDIQEKVSAMLRITNKLCPLLSRQDQLCQEDMSDPEYMDEVEEVLYAVIAAREEVFEQRDYIVQRIDDLLRQVAYAKQRRAAEISSIDYLSRAYLFFKTEIYMAVSFLKSSNQLRGEKVVAVLENISEPIQAFNNFKFRYYCT